MAVVRDERSLQELSAQAGTAHRTEGAWRRWLAWAAVIGVIVAIGLLFLPAGFPDSLTVPAAKPFNAAQDWVIQNDRTNPVFVHAITPFKNAMLASIDGFDILPEPTLTSPHRWPASDDLESWGLLPTRPNWAIGFEEDWTPGTAAALTLLSSVLSAVRVGLSLASGGSEATWAQKPGTTSPLTEATC